LIRFNICLGKFELNHLWSRVSWAKSIIRFKCLLCRSWFASHIPSGFWLVFVDSYHFTFGNLESIQTFDYKVLIWFNLNSKIPWIDSLFLPFDSIFMSTQVVIFSLLNRLKQYLIWFEHSVLVISWAQLTLISVAYIHFYPLII